MPLTRLSMVLAAVAVGACAHYDPPPVHRDVVTMKAHDAASVMGYPPAGTVWRLDESDLKKLSPAPIVDAPPPPRRPPPPAHYPYYPPPPPPWW